MISVVNHFGIKLESTGINDLIEVIQQIQQKFVKIMRENPDPINDSDTEDDADKESAEKRIDNDNKISSGAKNKIG
jgi:L-arabinose isomerase